MNKIKVVVFDVDGTLYDLVRHEIPASAIQAIQKMKENGVLFVIATGRTHYGLGKALNDLQPDYILAMNGSALADKDHHLIHSHCFTKEEVDRILTFAHQNDAGLIWKFAHHMYIYQHPEKIDWLEGQMNSDIGKEPFIDCPSQDHHLQELPIACCVHADPQAVAKAFGHDSDISFLPYSEDGYDVVKKGLNKSVGLLDLVDYLHLDLNQVACIGDNYNDLEMMKIAGTAIAMGNGIDEVKAIADYVTSSSDQDGIYHALKYLHCI